MRKGKVNFCYKHFLGYEKGEDGEPKIVEEEAKIVRVIYDLFLEGKSYTYIAQHLTDHNIPTPAGKTVWKSTTIKSILTNEKYTGDALLQKTFKRSYLDKRAYKNNGEKPQVIVENNHDAIIDKATFARVQELVKSRTRKHNSGTSKNPLSGKLVCSDCGEYFGHKTWTSRGRIKYSMWVCNHKYAEENSFGGNKCKTANLRQEWVEQGYLIAINELLAGKSQILGKYGRKLARIERRLDSGEIEAELNALDQERKTVDEQMATLKGEWEFSYGNNADYNEKQYKLELQAKSIVDKGRELEEERLRLNTDKKVIQAFIDTMDSLPDKLLRFHGNDFIRSIDHIEVSQFVLAYHFYGGECVKVNIELLKKLCKDMY